LSRLLPLVRLYSSSYMEPKDDGFIAKFSVNIRLALTRKNKSAVRLVNL
jgi:hypothetical protein